MIGLLLSFSDLRCSFFSDAGVIGLLLSLSNPRFRYPPDAEGDRSIVEFFGLAV